MAYSRTFRRLAFALASLFVIAAPAGAEGVEFSRDAFLVMLTSKLNSSCDNPKSPFTCLAKSPELCRKHLPSSAQKCVAEIGGQLPETVTKATYSPWVKKLGTCVLNHYIVALGAVNVDMDGCRKAKK